jgi:hypothetical protein
MRPYAYGLHELYLGLCACLQLSDLSPAVIVWPAHAVTAGGQCGAAAAELALLWKAYVIVSITRYWMALTWVQQTPALGTMPLHAWLGQSVLLVGNRHCQATSGSSSMAFLYPNILPRQGLISCFSLLVSRTQ